MNTNITVIGYGNLAKALISGWKQSRDITLSISSPSFKKKIPAEINHLPSSADNCHFVSDADLIVLAVKPSKINVVVEEIASNLTESSCIVSLAAGISCQAIETCLSKPYAIARAMPNTSAAQHLSPTALISNQYCGKRNQLHIETTFSALGPCFWLENETLMNAMTALIGSGPAFVYEFINQLSQSSQKFGLERNQANQLASQICFAAASIAKQNPHEVIENQAKIISPGGTTAAGLQVLKTHNLAQILDQTLDAAIKRAQELSP